MSLLNPKSIRPEPNRRYENVSEAELMQLGDDIITASREVHRLEHDPIESTIIGGKLTEWRTTLRLVVNARKKARRAAQGRLFDGLDGWQ